jgi:hypothetical protein
MQMANARENGMPEPEATAERDAPYQTFLAEILVARKFVTVASRKHNGAAATLRAR